MRLLATASTLLFMGLLSGCNAGTPATTAVEAAKQPQHNYQISGEFMVDSATGQVWRLKNQGDNASFVPVQVSQGPTVEEYVRDPKTGHLVLKNKVN